MKKLIIVGFSAALLAGGVSSCKKTSKGKMANEWSVAEMNHKDVTTNSNGTGTFVINMTTDKVTITDTDVDGAVNIVNGTVEELSYTIEKDGTWSSVTNYTTTISNESVGITYTSKEVNTNTASGTWNFLGNVEEFKKNERVVFNTLKENDKSVETISITSLDDEVITSTDDSEFANGENSKIYLVVESKKKELELSYEENYSSTSTETGSTTSNWSNVLTETISLVQK